MDLITIEDVNYLANQSSGKMNMILSGMTSLMNDTDKKVEMLESQDWFKRMVKTITGKNKLTQLEIQQNHDKLNAYMSQAIAELYNRNCIDHQVIMSLGVQLNEIYADHLQLKKMLGAFVTKLNEKIDSVDNFHMITTEINQGVYSQYPSIVAICKVISQLDKRILENDRKLDIIKRSLKEQEIINDDGILIKDYLMDIIDVSVDEVGQIYLELGTIRGNYMANIILRMIEKYHFLPHMARKLKDKDKLIDELMMEESLDESIVLSVNDIYDDFLNSKVEVNSTLVPIDDVSVDLMSDELYDIINEEVELENSELERKYENTDEDLNLDNPLSNVETDTSEDINDTNKEIEKELYDLIYNEYKSLNENFYDIYFNNNSSKSNEKIKYAVKYYANLDKDEHVIFCYDNTIFGLADKGIVFTNKGIHHKFSFQDKWFISHDDIHEIGNKKGDILINKTKEIVVCFGSRKKAHEFKLLLEKSISYAKSI